MKKLEKITGILISTIMCAGLVACGGASSGTTTTAKAAAAATTAKAAATTAKAASTAAATTKAAATTAAGKAATSSTVDLKGDSIEVEVTYNNTNLDGFKKIVDAFQQKTGCKVNLVTPGDDYESVMKTRMASGDLPDVWNTHGWSLIRYSEYLMPLNDCSWYSKEDPSVFGVMADKNGKIYALCASEVISGIEYNKDTLKAAGVDANSIHTWTDFEAACEKIKATGKAPIILGGAVSGNCAGLLGVTAPTFWTAKGAKYDLAKSLTDGSFDFNKYGTELYQLYKKWYDKGYFNKDVLTLDTDGAAKMLGSGEGAFMLRAANNITIARTYFPNANLGIIPFPGSVDGQASLFTIGEGEAFGIWKNTKHEKAAKAFLDFVAQPEQAAALCEIVGGTPALTDTKIKDSYVINEFQATQKAYGTKVQYDNVFDRKYFPSGMWSIMGDSVAKLMDNPTDAGIKEAVQYLADGYKEKMSAK